MTIFLYLAFKAAVMSNAAVIMNASQEQKGHIHVALR